MESARALRALLLFAGSCCVAFAILFNEWLLALFDPTLATFTTKIAEVRSAQGIAALVGLLLLAASALLGARGAPAPLRAIASNPLAPRVALAVLFVAIPLMFAELALRPFTMARHKAKATTLFVRDADLGWRLRPDTRDVWGGVEVEINGKGLRGPELPHARSNDALRLLYLGDSVAFGFKLGNVRDTFPYQVEVMLERQVGRGVETINGGVGGYSPWQHLVWLEREGIRYEPDLVVLTFVLNDVTEKLGLPRFGGNQMSRQLADSYHSLTDRLAHESALVMFLTQARARWKFGLDLREGAEQYERITALDLIEHPEKPEVERAWDMTLRNLQAIVQFCNARDLPIVMVVFPYRLQLADPAGSDAPQRVLAAFAEAHGLPSLDLLPAMSRAMTTQGLEPRDLFLDHSHPSVLGSRIASRRIAAFLRVQLDRIEALPR